MYVLNYNNMMMKFTYLIICSSLLFSCANNESEEIAVKEEEQFIIAEEEPVHEHAAEEAIVLDNGEKWVVVPEMLAFIRTMEKAVADFSENKRPTTEDYTALAVLLDENIRELTSNCTMEGQAHDELHKWLVPFIELSENFDVAEGVEEQEAIYKEFRASFINFNIYFN